MNNSTSTRRTRSDWLLLVMGLLSVLLGLWLASRPGAMWGVWVIVGTGVVSATLGCWWLTHAVRTHSTAR